MPTAGALRSRTRSSGPGKPTSSMSGLRLEPRLRVGDAVLAAILRAARGIVPADPLRQAGHRPVGPRRRTSRRSRRAWRTSVRCSTPPARNAPSCLPATRGVGWQRSTRPPTRSGRRRLRSSTRCRISRRTTTNAARVRRAARPLGRTGVVRRPSSYWLSDPVCRRGRASLVRELVAGWCEPRRRLRDQPRVRRDRPARGTRGGEGPDAGPLPARRAFRHGAGQPRRRQADPRRAVDARLRQRLLRDLPLARSRRRSRAVRRRRGRAAGARERADDGVVHGPRRLDRARERRRRQRVATDHHRAPRARSGASWRASAARNGTRPGTGSSRRSTARRVRSAPARRSRTRSANSASACASACTWASASSTTASRRGSL